jgi:hypothetical protein
MDCFSYMGKCKSFWSLKHFKCLKNEAENCVLFMWRSFLLKECLQVSLLYLLYTILITLWPCLCSTGSLRFLYLVETWITYIVLSSWLVCKDFRFCSWESELDHLHQRVQAICLYLLELVCSFFPVHCCNICRLTLLCALTRFTMITYISFIFCCTYLIT